MSFHVLGIGEVLWDLLETGPQLGGAPANFAYHAGTLGATAGVVSRVGNDSLGNAIQQKFAEMRLPVELLQVDASAATGTAAIELTGDGVPEFTIRPDVAWDFLAPTESALAAARRADAVCFWNTGPAPGTFARNHPEIVARRELREMAGVRRQFAPEFLHARHHRNVPATRQRFKAQ